MTKELKAGKKVPLEAMLEELMRVNHSVAIPKHLLEAEQATKTG